jgi:adenosine deaminase
LITVHLDGSLRVETLIELAEKDGLGFDRHTIEETFKDKYTNLEDYLGGFQYTVAVMQSAEV